MSERNSNLIHLQFQSSFQHKCYSGYDLFGTVVFVVYHAVSVDESLKGQQQ